MLGQTCQAHIEQEWRKGATLPYPSFKEDAGVGSAAVHLGAHTRVAISALQEGDGAPEECQLAGVPPIKPPY